MREFGREENATMSDIPYEVRGVEVSKKHMILSSPTLLDAMLFYKKTQ